MRHVSDRQSFWDVAPAAPNIFSYVQAHPQLRTFTLEFEYAMVDEASARAVVKFTCDNCPECQEAVVWVSALTQLDGSWAISHHIGSIR